MASQPCHCYLSIVLGSYAALMSLAGCQSEPKVGRAISPARSPQLPIESNGPTQDPVKNPVTFKVTVDSPLEDLKIKPGSFVRQGDIIATSAKRRSALMLQKRELESKLSALTSTNAANLNVQVEQQNIALAQKQFDAAQAALREYKVNSPWTDFARNNLPLAKEEVQLNRLQSNLEQAQANLDRAQAKLTEKQAAIGNFQTEQNLAKQTVQSELAQVTTQLTALKSVKSAHTGTVMKVDISQKVVPGQPVTVTVMLAPGELPQPLLPDVGASSANPSQPRSGSAIDLLPPSSSPDPSGSISFPNSRSAPNSVVE